MGQCTAQHSVSLGGTARAVYGMPTAQRGVHSQPEARTTRIGLYSKATAPQARQ